jgi:hypothetical protein
MRWLPVCTRQLRWAACRSSGWARAKSAVPFKLAGVRPSSSPSAGLQVITTPAGVSTAMPVGAYSKALRTLCARRSTDPVAFIGATRSVR